MIRLSELSLNLKKSKFFAGHSLGEYTALVCSGSLTLEKAAYLLNERGKFMQESVSEKEGAMLAILGMKIDEVENEIQTAPNTLGTLKINSEDLSETEENETQASEVLDSQQENLSPDELWFRWAVTTPSYQVAVVNGIAIAKCIAFRRTVLVSYSDFNLLSINYSVVYDLLPKY